MDTPIGVLETAEAAQMEKEYLFHPWASQGSYKPFLNTKAQVEYTVKIFKEFYNSLIYNELLTGIAAQQAACYAGGLLTFAPLFSIF